MKTEQELISDLLDALVHGPIATTHYDEFVKWASRQALVIKNKQARVAAEKTESTAPGTERPGPTTRRR